jgi:hypothetical protein
VIRKTLATLLLLSIAVGAQAVPIDSLDEGFDVGAPLTGWATINNSSPGGTTGWFQGNAGVFGAQSGAADSYAAANFENAGFGGNISNWLLTPELNLVDGATFSFFTRSNAVGFADRLELRLSVNGASGNVGATDASVGDFATLYLTLNPALSPDGYPSEWTRYTVTLSGVSGLTGRLGFRYNVTDTSVNGDYIGIDSVVYRIPEPGTLALFLLASASLALSLRRRTRIK